MKKLPRVAYLTGQYPEVSLTFIQREIEALRDLGAEVLTCSVRRTPPEQHPGEAEKEAARTTFHILEQMKNPLKLLAAQSVLFTRPRRYLQALKLALSMRPAGLRATAYQVMFFLEATILARHLEEKNVEHLHNHFVFGGCTVAAIASKLTGIPYSFTLHGPADLLRPYYWDLATKTANARFVATISHYARSQVMFFSDPAHWDKLHIIHCGVFPDRYAATDSPAIPPRREGEVRLLFVGRLAPVKGLRVLFKALAEVVPDLPHLHMVVVGDGPDRALLEAAAKPLGDAVTFTGYLSQAEVAQVMQGTDVLVLPSFAEGVPVVLMEALASARPVIATQVAGVSELVEDGTTGFLVPPGDATALADRIRRLASDPELRARLGAAGPAVVATDFNIRTEAARLATLFAGAADGAIRPDPWAAKDADDPQP